MDKQLERNRECYEEGRTAYDVGSEDCEHCGLPAFCHQY